MVSKIMKQNQLNPVHTDAITGVGEFSIPTTYKWTCNGSIVHITTRDRYRGIVSTEIPINAIRDILCQVDRANNERSTKAIEALASNVLGLDIKVQKPTKSKKSTPKTKAVKRKKPSILDLLPPTDSAEM